MAMKYSVADLFKTMEKKQYVDFRVDGDFHLSEQGTVEEISDEIESLNGNMDLMGVEELYTDEYDGDGVIYIRARSIY